MSDFDRLEKLIVQMHADITAQMTAGFAAVDARFDRERHETDARFDRERHETDARFDRMRDETDARFDRIDERFDRMRDETDARFDRIDARVDRIRDESDARFDRGSHETGMRFEAVRQEISLLAEGQAAILEKVERIDDRLAVVEEKVDFVAADTRILRADVAALGTRMDAVELRLPPAP